MITLETAEHSAELMRVSIGIEHVGSVASVAAVTGGYISYERMDDFSAFRLKKRNEFEYEIVLNSDLKGRMDEANLQIARAIATVMVCYNFQYIPNTSDRIAMISAPSSIARNSRKWHKEKSGKELDFQGDSYEKQLPAIKCFASALLLPKEMTKETLKRNTKQGITDMRTAAFELGVSVSVLEERVRNLGWRVTEK